MSLVSDGRAGEGLGPFGQSASERWQVVTQPAALPASCFLCNTGTEAREWFVDLNLSFEFWGAVYICNECFGTIARVVGWLDPSRAVEIKEQMQTLLLENFDLQRQVAALHDLEEAIDRFTSARRDRRDALRDGGSDSVSFLPTVDAGADSVDAGGEGLASDGPEPVVHGEGSPAEPSDDEGVDFLRPDAGGSAVFSIDL